MPGGHSEKLSEKKSRKGSWKVKCQQKDVNWKVSGE